MITKKVKTTAAAAIALVVSCLSACDDDITQIGNSLVSDQLEITVDSTIHSLKANTAFDQSFDARSQSLLLGNLSARKFGSITSGFVTQLMPAYSLNVPDSIDKERIDSVRVILRAQRGALTGDSLMPQQFTIYSLTRPLPADITSSFNPDGYYDPSDPLTSASYTLSKLHLRDSAFYKGNELRISAKLPLEYGTRIWDAYKTNPSVFQWPATFAEKFPGLYVRNTFGSGSIAQFKSLTFMIYYHKLVQKNHIVDGVNVPRQEHQADSVSVFTTAPEVLSSNVIAYRPDAYVKTLVDAGKSVISSPGGYMVTIEFPLDDMLRRYFSNDHNLSVISNLTLQIPGNSLENGLGLNCPPYLLMVKTSKLKEFFANNKVPDGIDSFWASYDSDKGCYRFTSMRQYFINAVNAADQITPDDYKFTIVPVNVVVESYRDQQYKEVTTVTSCKPYLGVPSLTLLDTDRAMICLTYSNQVIK